LLLDGHSLLLCLMASCLVPLPLLAALGVILKTTQQKIQRRDEEKRFCTCFPETIKKMFRKEKKRLRLLALI